MTKNADKALLRPARCRVCEPPLLRASTRHARQRPRQARQSAHRSSTGLCQGRPRDPTGAHKGACGGDPSSPPGGIRPSAHPIRRSTFAAVVASHLPPRAVPMPRPFSAAGERKGTVMKWRLERLSFDIRRFFRKYSGSLSAREGPNIQPTLGNSKTAGPLHPQYRAQHRSGLRAVAGERELAA